MTTKVENDVKDAAAAATAEYSRADALDGTLQDGDNAASVNLAEPDDDHLMAELRQGLNQKIATALQANPNYSECNVGTESGELFDRIANGERFQMDQLVEMGLEPQLARNIAVALRDGDTGPLEWTGPQHALKESPAVIDTDVHQFPKR